MRRLSLALVSVALLFAAPVDWQRASHCLAQTPDLPGRQGLLANQQFVRLAIISGRLEAVGLEVYGRTINTAQESNNRREHLTVGMSNEGVSLRYDARTDDEEFTFDILSDARAYVRRKLPAGKAAAGTAETIVEYEQIGRQPLVLTVSHGEQVQRHTAPTLWHLLIAEPTVCQNYLVPLFDRLKANWGLQLLAEETKQALLRTAALPRVDEADQWRAWVADLASEKFSARQQADRQLRQAGHAALPFLQGLGRRSLDAEQWRRVQEIVLSYREVVRDDTVEQNVLRLIGDRAMWLTLLDDADSSNRTLAAAQLTRILGQPIAFDPRADEAKRRQQIEALRTAFNAQR